MLLAFLGHRRDASVWRIDNERRLTLWIAALARAPVRGTADTGALTMRHVDLTVSLHLLRTRRLPLGELLVVQCRAGAERLGPLVGRALHVGYGSS
ncbi:MAG TPA: hypothetical protein VFB92_26465 [Vicinamibacterales bacterium]|nr:hypothetical protein [Vicinamibacterales bacterium]